MKLFSSNPIEKFEEVLTIIRVVTGLLLAYHGLEIFDSKTMAGYTEWEMFKNSSGRYLTYFGKFSELVAGLLLALGLMTRFASVWIIGTMLYICFLVGHGQFWYGDQHPFLFVLLALVYFALGGSKYSLDKLYFSK